MSLPDEITINGVLYVKAEAKDARAEEQVALKYACLDHGITVAECIRRDRSTRFTARRNAVINALYADGWAIKDIARVICRDRSIVERALRCKS